MFFSKKKKKRVQEQEHFEENIRSIEKNEQEKSQFYIVELCEQMVEASKTYEETKKEYDRVTNYLNDVQIIEDYPEEERGELVEVAANISALNQERSDYLKSESRISDEQYFQMQEIESEMPAALKRFESNEKYLETVKRDLKYIEGEKTEWEIVRSECILEQKQLRKIAVLMFILSVLCIILVFLSSMIAEIDTQLGMIVIAFAAVVVGAYVFLKYQDCAKEIKKSELCQNRAIVLENRVKFKYVNTKNAVDYACQKYHVKNSYELRYLYEQYIETVREQEKIKRTNSQLEMYQKDLLAMLAKHNLYEAKTWLLNTDAIVDRREMVEVKHELLERRKNLRSRMEYNIGIVSNLKNEILDHMDEAKEYAPQVERILIRMNQLNMGL